MRIQFLNGGLANQTFQYIFARYYELDRGEPMYLDDSYFALNTVHNGYELEKVFGIKPHMLSDCFDEEVWGFMLEERKKGKSIPTILCENGIDFYMLIESTGWEGFNPFDGRKMYTQTSQYNPEIFDIPDDVYYHGYWINKNWFMKYQENFRNELSFPPITDEKNKKYQRRIRRTKSLSIHIRRGDFVPLGWAFPAEYYCQMLHNFVKKVPGKWELFVFSDDIPWCCGHWKELGFQLFEDVTYIEGNVQGKNYIDMQLMSQCKGMIVSGSTFCYLAALLNTGKEYWMNPTEREL